ncbi:hypothetical protein R6258_01720 [Halomonas sp. HP20-15]|uniref:hypothetical protein n=1 Tax=Halomonas sp. HP20-15 TaxID=3085901 RepID=UPI002981E711|nr:hypothetical protein [Halomonas sp. HP20-15]MDW5375625.1 hypothetical protein [Halomonas sp. HP20-15]
MTRDIDLALLYKYDQPASDYGTFPAVVRFSKTLGADSYRLAALSSNEDPIPKPLTAYVHMPSWPCRDSGETARYLDCLKREIALQGALFDADRRIGRLVLVGNRASHLGDDQLADVLDELHHYFGLEPRRDASLCFEPSRLSTQRLAALGFNRLTVGAADLGVASGLTHRPQPSTNQDWLNEWTAARRACLRPFAIDLTLELAGATESGFSALLESLVHLRPERLTLRRDGEHGGLGLSYASTTGQEVSAPERRVTLTRLVQGLERLVPAGYVHLGMGHFALSSDTLAAAQRHGWLRRCLQGYDARGDSDCIGLGAGAISLVADGYYQNARQSRDYCARLESGKLAIRRGYELSADDRLRRDVIRHLMGSGGVIYEAIEKRHRIVFGNYFAPEMLALQAMANDGLVNVRRDSIGLTQVGRLLMNRIAMIFDGAFNQLQPRRLQMIR